MANLPTDVRDENLMVKPHSPIQTRDLDIHYGPKLKCGEQQPNNGNRTAFIMIPSALAVCINLLTNNTFE